MFNFYERLQPCRITYDAKDPNWTIWGYADSENGSILDAQKMSIITFEEKTRATNR